MVGEEFCFSFWKLELSDWQDINARERFDVIYPLFRQAEQLWIRVSKARSFWERADPAGGNKTGSLVSTNSPYQLRALNFSSFFPKWEEGVSQIFALSSNPY